MCSSNEATTTWDEDFGFGSASVLSIHDESPAVSGESHSSSHQPQQ